MSASVTGSAHGVHMLNVDTGARRAHDGIMMGNTIKLAGAIDRSDPDPGDVHNPWRAHVGWTRVEWRDENGAERTSLAALIRDSSGRASSGETWAGSVLCLVWIGTTSRSGYRGGDAPTSDVVQATYDWIVDRGPARGTFAAQLVAQQRSEAQPSYRAAV